MANRESAIGRGLGSVDAVFCHVTKSAANSGFGVLELEQLSKALNECLNSSTIRCHAVALLAAHMNTDFRDSGRLFSVRDSGQLTYDYYATERERELIADLLTD